MSKIRASGLFFLTAVGCLLACSDRAAVVAAGAPEKDRPGEYRPRFSFKNAQDIAYRGQKFSGVRLFDNDRHIADVVADPKVYPPSVARAINVRLSPASRQSIRWWDIMHRGGAFSDNKLSVDDGDPQALKLAFAAREPNRGYRVRAESVLTYDNNLDSYVYQVTVEKVPDKIESYEFLTDWWEEYWKTDGVTYSRTGGCYCNLDCGRNVSHFVHQDRNGRLAKVPHHSLLAPDKYNIRLKKGGAKIVLLGNPERALMIELPGETATDSQVALCNAGFDVWLSWVPQPGRNRARAKFKIYSYDKTRADKCFQDAEIAPFTDQEFATLCLPAYQADRHPISDFESGIDLRKHDRRAFWSPYGYLSKMQWCRTSGHSGKGSLKTETDKPVECYWEVAPLVATHRYINVPPGSSATVSVWIKTEDLQGEGAYFKAGFCRTYTDWIEVVESRKLTGTNDWTKLSVKLPAVNGEGRFWLRVKLVHNGKGTSYFDDVDYAFADR